MTPFVEESSLTERLKTRRAVEEQFARAGRKFRNKAFIFRHEDIFIKPWVKLGLRAVGLYGRGLRNAISPVFRRLTFEFAALPPAFDGFEILHLSDLHIDGVDGLVEALTPTLEAMRPDICVMTGDYRFEDEGSCAGVYPRMQRIVSSLRAKHGVFGILGNHDVSEIAFALEDMGVQMLVNEAVEVHRANASVWLAGIDDPFDYQCDDLEGALAATPENAFKILLAHTPQLYAEAAQRGVELYLCGHTHGGQVRLPGIGSIRHNAPCPRTYSYGQWQYEGMQGYTSVGAGCSMMPIRYNCPPEVVIIELRRAPSE